MMKNVLRLEKILDFYDVPQLFVGRDKFDAQYICLLYDDVDVCRFTAVKISGSRLQRFLSGSEDLRSIFVNPENAGEFFDVVYDNNNFEMTPLQKHSIEEKRLPEAGYTIDADTHETMTVNLPVKDHGLFTELVHKFGWACL